MLATPRPTSTTESRSRLHRILRLEHILPRASLQLQQEANRRRERSPLLLFYEGAAASLLHIRLGKECLFEVDQKVKKNVGDDINKLFETERGRTLALRLDVNVKRERSAEVLPLAQLRLCRMALSKVLKHHCKHTRALTQDANFLVTHTCTQSRAVAWMAGVSALAPLWKRSKT